MTQASNDVHVAVAALVAELPLTPAHRASLKQERGFTDALIETLEFRSAGEHAAVAVGKVAAAVGPAAAREAGLLVQRRGQTVDEVHPDLLTDNVVIPFRVGGRYHYWQTHKKALSGDIAPIQPYVPGECLTNLNGKPVVLAESAFKAAAAWQYGFPAVGLPGISSFAGKHFPRLAAMLAAAGPREVVVLFDNEVKDGSEGSRRVENPMNRYDTQFWSYVVATMLADVTEDGERDGEGERAFRVRIGTLPDEWRVKGKIDIDGALAQGRSPEEFAAVLSGARSPAGYIEAEKAKSVEAARVLGRKVGDWHQRQRARVKEDEQQVGYFIWVPDRQRDGRFKKKFLSDFVVRIRNRYDTPDGRMREAVLLNARGEESRPFKIDPGGMANLQRFREFCYAQGDFTWRGSLDDLQEVWQLEFMRQDARLIRQPDHIGWVDEAGGWLFRNALLLPGGAVVRADEREIMWPGDDEVGWSAHQIEVGSSGAKHLPQVWLGTDDLPNWGELGEALSANWGGFQGPKLCLGWVAACLCSHWLFDAFNAFPLLFVEGKSRSGKTTLCRWLMRLAGVEQQADYVEQATEVAMSRNMAYFSSLPYELSEYRCKREIRRKEGLLRCTWDRQGASKGLRTPTGIRKIIIRSGVLVSGEDAPPDEASLTRYITISLERARLSTKGGDNSTFHMMNRLGRKLGAFPLHVARMVPDPDALVARVRAVIAALHACGNTDERVIQNYATAAACYLHCVKPDDQEFLAWLNDEVRRSREEKEDEAILQVFLDDIAELHTLGRIGQETVHRGPRDPDHLWIYFPRAFSAWEEYMRQRGRQDVWTSRTMKKYLMEEPWVADGKSTHAHQFADGKVRRAVKCRFADAPESLRQMVADETREETYQP